LRIEASRMMARPMMKATTGLALCAVPVLVDGVEIEVEVGVGCMDAEARDEEAEAIQYNDNGCGVHVVRSKFDSGRSPHMVNSSADTCFLCSRSHQTHRFAGGT
jgi:hypothetical protein